MTGNEKKILIGSFIIVAVAAAMGLICNKLRPDPLPLIRKPVQESRRSVTKDDLMCAGSTASSKKRSGETPFVSIRDARVLFDERTALFVDARSDDAYTAGHISGAISCYWRHSESLVCPELERKAHGRVVVVFSCDSECHDAIRLADALSGCCNSRVAILAEGMRGWKAARFPITRGEEP